MKKNQEVNVTNPDAAKQQAMNPYAFISLYKKGYNLDMKTVGTNYQVHLTAQNKKNAIKEMYILVNKSSYKLTQIKMRQSNGWTTINVSNLQTKNLSDNTFRFNAKDYPQAEIIDLR
jgi:outer membrane lipoprotein-sorting protein